MLEGIELLTCLGSRPTLRQVEPVLFPRLTQWASRTRNRLRSSVGGTELFFSHGSRTGTGLLALLLLQGRLLGGAE
jgi:hypothetical protein